MDAHSPAEAHHPRPDLHQPDPGVTTQLTVRRATHEDLPSLVAMLADDPLGAKRETPHELTAYERAFTLIDTDPNQCLMVAECAELPGVVATLQLTFIPGLSRQGASRALVEAVRVRAEARGTGLGTQLVQWAIEESRRQGCALIQLTTDASRHDAHRFYDRLGFEASHVGLKMTL